jgi:two-component system, OmpR family, sensor histidine kinase KdpD
MDADLFVVYVDIHPGLAAEEERSLSANLAFGENLGAKVARPKGKDVATAIAAFAREKHITQVIFARSAVEGRRKYLSALSRFLRDAPAVWLDHCARIWWT